MMFAAAGSLGVEPLSLSEVDQKPVAKFQLGPAYPYEMRKAGMGGDVLVEFVISKDGDVRDASVIGDPVPEFAEVALAAIRRWEFIPARKGGQPVDVRVKLHVFFEMEFILDGDKILTLGHTDRPPPDAGDLPTFTVGIESPYITMPADKSPILTNEVKAIYPFPLLAAGITGKAQIRYIIGENGAVAYASILSASKREFGEAALAMVQARRFQPPTHEGRPRIAIYDLSVNFRKGSPDLNLNENTWKLLEEEKQLGRKFASPGKLDGRLTPRIRVSPVDLRQPPTKPQTVVVECIIDQNGDVQLPRIVKAEDQDCAYAALTAISQWKFSPPMKNGQPVDARVQIPIDFR